MEKKKMTIRFFGVLAAAWMATTASPSFADSADSASNVSATAAQTFDFFLQEAKVYTASRREQNKSDSPVAIEVITSDEIKASGAQTIPDLLRFRVGMNVSEEDSIEGVRENVNIRGLPDEFVQGIQVLIDGRSVVSPIDESVYWQDFPIAIDDIERIEIVRGPNAALYGSNAAQGVINIITKKPTDSDQASAREEVGSYTDHKGYASGNFPTTLGNVRVSMQEAAREDSWPGPQGNALSSGDQEGSLMLGDARMDSKPWNNGEIETFFGGNKDSYAIPDDLGISSTNYDGDYEMMKLSQDLGDGFSLNANGSRDDANYGAGIYTSRATQYNGELLGHLAAWDGRSQSELGVSYRYELADSAYIFNEFVPGPGAHRDNRVGRIFASESIQLADWATLATALSDENSDTGGVQQAYQGALILKPIENWNLRLAASRAPTLPSLLNRSANLLLPEGTYANTPAPGATTSAFYNVQGGPVEASTVSSYEGTLSGALFNRELTVEVTPYDMDIEGYPEFEGTGSTFTQTGLATFNDIDGVQYQNDYSFVLRGVESVINFKPVLGANFQINHTYEDVYYNNRTGGISERYEGTTPWNILNAVVSMDLPWSFDASANFGWTGEHNAYSASRGTVVFVPDQGVLDLRLGYHLFKGAEAYVLGQNLLQEYRIESPDGTSVPQAYYCGLTLSWEGSKP